MSSKWKDGVASRRSRNGVSAVPIRSGGGRPGASVALGLIVDFTESDFNILISYQFRSRWGVRMGHLKIPLYLVQRQYHSKCRKMNILVFGFGQEEFHER